MAADGSVIIDVEMDSDSAKKQLKEVEGNLKTGLASAAKVAAVAVAGIAIAIGAVTAASKQFAATTDRIDKLSQKIGISRRAFQEWEFVLSQSGADVGILQTSMKTLSSAVDKAAGGTKSYADKFERLGVSIKDTNGEMKDQETLFNEVFTALSNMENQTERTAIASELLGRAATELAPAFNAGGEAIDGMKDRAHDLGLVLEDDTIDAGVQLTDAMDQMERAFKSIMTNAFLPFADSITKIVTGIADFISDADAMKDALDLIGIVALTAAGAIGIFMLAFKSAAVLSAIGAALSGIATAFTAIAVAVKAVTLAMASNPFGAIAVVLTAILIPAIILLIKNWDSVSTFMLESLAKMKQSIIILAAKTEGTLTVAFNSVKIAVVSLAQTILDKLAGNIIKFLDFAADLPFVGKLFEGISDKANGLKSNLYGMAEEAKVASAKAIKAAEEQETATVAAANKELRSIKNLALGRKQATARAESEAAMAAKAAEEAANAKDKETESEDENTDAVDDNTAAKVKAVKTATALEQASDRYSGTLDVINNKEADGMATTAKAQQDKLDAVNSYIDSLYTLGAVQSGTGEADRALKDAVMSKALIQRAIADAGKKAKDDAGNIPVQIAEGMKKKSYTPIEYVKKLTDDIKGEFTEGLSKIKTIGSRVGSVFSGSFSDGLSEAKGIGADTMNSLSGSFSKGASAAKGMGGKIAAAFKMIVGVIADVIKGFITALNFLADFDPKAIFESIDNLISGVVEFFMEDLGTIPIYFDKIMKTILDGMSTLMQNMPAIMESVGNVLDNILDSLGKDGPKLIKDIITFVKKLALTIIKKLPTIIKVGLELAIALVEGVADAMPELIPAIIDVFPDVIIAILDALPALVEAFILMIPMIAEALILASPQIVLALISIIPALIIAVAKITGVLITGLIDTIITMFVASGSLIWNGISGVFTWLVEQIGSAFMAAFDFGKWITDAIIDGFNAAADAISDTASDLWEGAVGLGSDIGNAISGWFANGTMNAPGGLSIVGERGPELVNLPKGSQVYTAGDTEKMLSGAYSSVLNGISGSAPQPIITHTAATDTAAVSSISIALSLDGAVNVDGRAIGEIVYQYLDEVAAG